jgi:hypothetical protein
MGWFLIGFSMLVIFTMQWVLRPTFLTFGGIVSYFTTIIGVIFMIGLPATALNVLGKHWDSSHWVMDMTEGNRKQRTHSTLNTLHQPLSYIQQSRNNQPSAEALH